jgi:hypothetical protein
MPTPLKTSENIRKHLTKVERAARQRAEGEMSRINPMAELLGEVNEFMNVDQGHG